MSASQAAFEGDIGSWAETWTRVYTQNPYPHVGDYMSSARITVDGFWSADLDSLAGGSEVRLTAFVRDYSGNLDSREVLHKTSNIIDLWSGNDTFSVDLYANLQTSSLYEVGIRAQTTAQALSYSAGRADCYPDDNIVQYSGRHEFDSLELTWI